MSNKHGFPTSDHSNNLNEDENNRLCEFLTEKALLVCLLLVNLIP